jgi:hypothetical protein
MDDQHVPPAAVQPSAPRRRGIAIGVLGAIAGCAAGAIIAGSMSANATTSGNGTASGNGTTSGNGTASASAVASSSTVPGAPPAGPAGGPAGGRYRAPATTGTVTAVGSNSVTIKTSAGTKTYAVTASSDIDKNGEATLSDLKAGDAVRFDVVPNTSTIGHLHAGDEALDRPSGRH